MSEWPYLETEALRARQALAGYALRGYRVVEIGGGASPVPDAEAFDPRAGSEVVLEASRPLGVALLGLDLRDMTDEAWGRLGRVVRAARRVVVEYAVEWGPGFNQQARIAAMGLRLVWHVELDFKGNAMPVGPHPPRLRRRLMVLEPR